jgi:cobalt-zinc-cadmium efflux system protein
MPSKAEQLEIHDHTHEHDHNHGHDHEHGHSHSEGQFHAHFTPAADGKLGLAFKLALGITAAFVGIEFAAGWLTGSLALISDAGHNLTDAIALAFSLWALNMARRKPNLSKTYGYHRAGILAAALNSAVLVLLSLYIVYEAVERFLNPVPIDGGIVAIIAAVALAVNLTAAALLLRWSKEDLNTRSAFLHVVSDAAASVGVIIAGLLALFTGWQGADPAISILISVLILRSSWLVLKEATNVLLEGTPSGVDMVDLLRDMMRQPHVTDVHDLHVWTIGSGFRALSCHVKLEGQCDLKDANQTIQNLSKMLRDRYDIRHATIQVDAEGCEIDEVFCC